MLSPQLVVVAQEDFEDEDCGSDCDDHGYHHKSQGRDQGQSFVTVSRAGFYHINGEQAGVAAVITAGIPQQFPGWVYSVYNQHHPHPHEVQCCSHRIDHLHVQVLSSRRGLPQHPDPVNGEEGNGQSLIVCS